MIRLTLANACEHLDQLCDAAVRGESVIIERPNREDVALVAACDLSALEETAYLLRSPANAIRLFTALERVQGRGSSESRSG